MPQYNKTDQHLPNQQEAVSPTPADQPLDGERYTIDEIIAELNQDHADRQSLTDYIKEHGAFHTTMLLADILGDDDIFAQIAELGKGDLSPEEIAQTERLLEEILSGQLTASSEQPDSATGRTPTFLKEKKTGTSKLNLSQTLRTRMEQQEAKQSSSKPPATTTSGDTREMSEQLKSQTKERTKTLPHVADDAKASADPFRALRQQTKPMSSGSAAWAKSKASVDPAEHKSSEPARPSSEAAAPEVDPKKPASPKPSPAPPAAAKPAPPSKKMVRATRPAPPTNRTAPPKTTTASPSKDELTRLKYLTLRKNRESVVRDFSLETDFSIPLLPDEQKKSHEPSISIANIPSDDAGDLPLKEATAPIARNKKTPVFSAEQFKRLGKQEPIRIVADCLACEPLDDDAPELQNEIKELLQDRKQGLLCRWIIHLVLLGLTWFTVALNTPALGIASVFPLLDLRENPLVYLWFHGVLAVLLLVVSADLVHGGLSSLFAKRRKKINRMTLFALTMIAYCAVYLAYPIQMILGMTALEEPDLERLLIYLPLLSLVLTVSYTGRFRESRRIWHNLQTAFMASKPYRHAVELLDHPLLVKDFTRGAIKQSPQLVFNRKVPYLNRFLEQSFCENRIDRQAVYLVPLTLVTAFAVAAALFFLQDSGLWPAMAAFSGVMVAGLGVSSTQAIHGAFHRPSKVLRSVGSSLLGVRATAEFAGVNAMTLQAADLFVPEKDITLYGIKTFANTPIDRAILDAIAVLRESNSIFLATFMNIIADRIDYLDPVDNVIYEDGLGTSAWIQNRRILIGSRELMVHHNVGVPDQSYETSYLEQGYSLLYLSAAGTLNAIFLVGLACTNQKRNLVVDAYNNGLTMIVKSVDPILTKEKLAQVFEVPEDTFRVIPSRLHKEVDARATSDTPLSGGLCNDGGLRGYLYGVIAAKQIDKTIATSMWLHTASILLLLVLFLAFALLPDAMQQLDPVKIALYHILWVVIISVVQRWRNIIG